MSLSLRVDLRKTPFATVWLLVLSGLFPTPAAQAYRPESPEVQDMLKRATTYLMGPISASHGPGGEALIALALYKTGVEPSSAKIKAAIESARAWAQSSGQDFGGSTTYTPALCFILLAEVDPDGSRQQLDLLLKSILARQRPSGSWTYYPAQYDDTSQAQYGLLSLWAAHQLGMEVPVESVERAAAWLVRSQHPGGGWSYRPLPNIDSTPTTDARHVEVTHSMCAAAGGSLYVCAHLLGFLAQQQDPKSELPPALTKVENEADRRGKSLRPRNTSPQMLAPAVNGANGWFAKNLNYDTKWWTHYYMYGLERYKSFQELIDGNKNREPTWYNQGVEFLRKTQRQDGSWQTETSHPSGPVIDTAFAVLFLTRSSQKMIQKAVLAEGKLIGGHGLPKDLTNARLQDGKVVTPQMVRDVDDLMELLKGAEDKDFDALALPGGLSLDADLTKRTSQLERLRSLVTNEDFNARLVAVKTLARSRELDNVPALIYALSDIDPRIVHEADSGLRFISRKFWGYGLTESPTPEQKQAAQAKWKEWFLSIRPDAAFLD